jgi:hypothetical protein
VVVDGGPAAPAVGAAVSAAFDWLSAGLCTSVWAAVASADRSVKVPSAGRPATENVPAVPDPAAALVARSAA